MDCIGQRCFVTLNMTGNAKGFLWAKDMME